jgi:hypothetical protein
MPSRVTRFIFALLLGGALAVQVADSSPTAASRADVVARLSRHEFHSNLHVNLHHYLFELGLMPDPAARLAAALPQDADPAERAAFESAVSYYRAKLAHRDLLFDTYLSNIKQHLLRHASSDALTPGRMDAAHHAALLAARPAYERYVWPRHDAANRRIVADSLELLRTIEAPTLARIEALAGERFPDRLLVHLSWYGGEYNGYTTIHPATVAVISSRAAGTARGNDDFVELVFHEPAHALILPDRGTVAAAIADASRRQGIEAPRNLWHALLFYLVGAAVEEQMAAHGRPDYVMYMRRNQVFASLHHAIFAPLPAYLAGQVTLQAAVDKVLRRHAARPRP